MHLEYFDLLSPNPIPIQNVGGILSPKLKDIASIGYKTYQYYLAVLQMDFDVFTADPDSVCLLESALNFFIQEDVAYSAEQGAFLITQEGQLTGAVTKEIYGPVCDLIFQRNGIKAKQEDDLSKVKSKKALEIMKKLQKGRAEKAKHAKTDKNMELGNILSAVANKSPSINIINIWELTVYQLWDCFSRLSNNNIYAIQSMSVAAWGNKDNLFDATAWFKRIDTTN